MSAGIEVGRSLAQKPNPVISTFDDIRKAYRTEMREWERENLVAVFLDRSNQVIGDKILFRGHLRSVVVRPMELVREARDCEASSVVVLHNHPDGGSQPTPADRETTQQIKDLLDDYGIHLFDHVIVGREDCYSFKQAGILGAAGGGC